MLRKKAILAIFLTIVGGHAHARTLDKTVFTTSIEGDTFVKKSVSYKGLFKAQNTEFLVEISFENRSKGIINFNSKKTRQKLIINSSGKYSFNEKFSANHDEDGYNFYIGVSPLDDGEDDCPMLQDDRLFVQIQNKKPVIAKVVRISGCEPVNVVLPVSFDGQNASISL